MRAHRTSRTSFRAAVLLVGLATAGSGVSVGLAALHLNRPAGRGPAQQVRIEPGMSARSIGSLLQSRGIIRSAKLFGVLARLQGLGHRLEAGTYTLDGSQPTAAVLRTLLKAPLHNRRFTVPEGLTRYEIAALLERSALGDSARFVHLTSSPALAASLGVPAPNLEGFLFPETYFLEETVAEEALIRRMVAEFNRVFDDPLRVRLSDLGLSLRGAVTLASIVEREAMVDHERPIIAEVFLRRLQSGRRLESCATVAYALGRRKARLSSADLQIDSPYNTYRHEGLPPGPIGNPGRAALLAVLYPADTDYLYFVARGDGTHIFSRTNGEHERARRAVRDQR